MGLHTREGVHKRVQYGTIRKPYSLINSRLSSTAVRDFGSGEITDWEHQRPGTLHYVCDVQNFIPSNMSDSIGTSLRLMAENSGIRSG